jgi:long-chain fatty acid transport protein
MKLFMKSFIVIILLSTLVAAQTGTRMVGFNAKSIGRGGASIGTFDSPELMMTNPAGISFLNNSMLDVSFTVMLPKLHFKNSLNDVAGDDNIFPLPNLAYVNKRSEGDFSWGVGMFTAGGMGADFKLKHALFREQNGSFTLQEYHSQLAAMQGGLTLAYKLSDNISVGVSLHLVFSMLEFWMPYSLSPLAMQGTAKPGMTFGQMFAAPPSMGGFGYDEVTAFAKMSDLTGIGFNGKIGLAYKVNDELSLGVSYTLPTSLTYTNGKALMDMTYQLNDAFGKAVQGVMMQNPGMTPQQAQTAVMQMFGQLGIDMSKGVVAQYDLDVDLKFPQSIGFGISYKPTEKFGLSADVEWLNWEDAFDKMTLKLSGGANPNINKMMGNNGSFNIDFPMNWENQILFKVGGEYNVTNELTLRLGFANGANPVPATTIFPVFPAVVETHLMVGISYKISDGIILHSAFETALNNSAKAAAQSLIANEYDNSASDLATTLFNIGFSYGF